MNQKRLVFSHMSLAQLESFVACPSGKSKLKGAELGELRKTIAAARNEINRRKQQDTAFILGKLVAFA